MVNEVRINNFRCFQNFNLKFDKPDTEILLGLNGVGKSTFIYAFVILRDLVCGYSEIADLISEEDFALGNKDVPMRFAFTFQDGEKIFKYTFALEMPRGFKKPRVYDERFSCGADTIFERTLGNVTLSRSSNEPAKFVVDWHRLAIAVIQDDSPEGPVLQFRKFVENMIIISPAPTLINSMIDNADEYEHLYRDCSNFATWLDSLQRRDFRIGQTIVERMRDSIYPDLLSYSTADEIKKVQRLRLLFGKEGELQKQLDFATLSDGEKCMFISAAISAKLDYLDISLCLWDEPDNYLAISEVRAFISGMRKKFLNKKRQLFITSHNPTAIEALPYENMILFMRDSHLEPARCKRLDEVLESPNEKKHFDLLLLTGRLYDAKS